MPAERPSTTEALKRLERWGADQGWVGPDPYEGLNSPLGRVATTARTRQAVIQAYKRSPVRPPWPLRVAPTANAKALALALSGYATKAGARLAGATRFVEALPAKLAQMNRLDHGAAWGYPFDVQTRHLFYDRRTPNAVATCFVVGALIDAFEATGDSRQRDLALAARPYLLSLRKESTRHGPFFAYVDSGSELVHNANLLVCGALARLHALEPHDDAAAIATAAAQTTIALQREDALWDYGEANNLRWADNFHTAYVIEALVRVREAYGVGGEALARSVPAWRDRFFDASGRARYFPDSRFPLEPHCYASAIDCLVLIAQHDGEGDSYLDQARALAQSATAELWLERQNCFGFRRTRRGLNRRIFMRWTNAPMFRALVSLESSEMGQ